MTITELREIKIPDDLFTIPKEAIIKYNVPKKDWHGLEHWYNQY